jgi:Ca2+-binding RTX toxin-like protein
MAVGRGTAVLVTVGLFLGAAQTAGAAVRSEYIAQPLALQGTLRVESDAADSIVVACVGARVEVNGAAPDTGPLECSRPTRIEVVGGPGDNRIDLGGITPAQSAGTYRGVAASATVDGGAGDDTIVGAAGGYVRIAGGAGNDWMQGRGGLDTYVFAPAPAPERDTIVEPVDPECDDSYVETNQPGRSSWTVVWDAVDFSALESDDSLTLDERAPEGQLASHRNRTVFSPRSSQGVAIEAVMAGPGNDRVTAHCMAVGSAGNDLLAGAGRAGSLLLGGLGDDSVTGGRGPDRLEGGAGADRIGGGAGEDGLVGESGDDTLHGGADGDVYLFGAADSAQSDLVGEASGPGLDVLSFDFGGGSRLTADLSRSSGVLARAQGFELRAEPGAARFFEGLVGTRGNDRLIGHDGRNHFWSGGGTDLVAGRRGNDVYHVDWSGLMPYWAYSWGEVWFGPFDRGSEAGRSVWTFAEIRRSRLRILETARGGFDTVNVSVRWLARTDGGVAVSGQVESGVRADLGAPVWIVDGGRVGALSARRGGARHLEGLRGTARHDGLFGNAAGNTIAGLGGPDRVFAGRGNDLCVNGIRPSDRDFLRGCERVRRQDPER